MLRLNNLKSPKGSHRKKKRIGRGQGSGWGTQAGKGHKGQKARKGGGKTISGFEGGQMPVYRRLPKKGFKNVPFKKKFAVLNLGTLDKIFAKEEVSRQLLIDARILRGQNKKGL